VFSIGSVIYTQCSFLHRFQRPFFNMSTSYRYRASCELWACDGSVDDIRVVRSVHGIKGANFRRFVCSLPSAFETVSLSLHRVIPQRYSHGLFRFQDIAVSFCGLHMGIGNSARGAKNCDKVPHAWPHANNFAHKFIKAINGEREYLYCHLFQ
jgi:hypothetical protein